MLFLQGSREIFLYNKQNNNVWILGSTKFISRVDKKSSLVRPSIEKWRF